MQACSRIVLHRCGRRLRVSRRRAECSRTATTRTMMTSHRPRWVRRRGRRSWQSMSGATSAADVGPATWALWGACAALTEPAEFWKLLLAGAVFRPQRSRCTHSSLPRPHPRHLSTLFAQGALGSGQVASTGIKCHTSSSTGRQQTETPGGRGRGLPWQARQSGE